MSDIDSIWDDDEIVVQPRASTSTEPLFLHDEDDDDREMDGPPPPVTADLAQMFDDIDNDPSFDFQPVERLDLAEEKRKADARNRDAMDMSSSQHEILPSSSPAREGDGGKTKGKGEGQKKEKKKIMKLDEERLLGPEGFPQLIKDTKHFRIKGKGHEVEDLNRLLRVYQFWSHTLYPRTQFKDTVERVEKLCHSRRMHSKLGVWRDEAKGKKPAEPESDEEPSAAGESDVADYAPSSAAPTRPPSSTGDSDPDLDDLIREAEGLSDHAVTNDEPMLDAVLSSTSVAKSTAVDQDEEMYWDEIDDGPPAVRSMDDDEDMWSIVDEAQREEHSISAKPPSKEPPEEEDWDDIYV
ncbi:replication fork protection component Swi3-domain-containing protein [Mycena floridula]|nr:replication fork protection component Swi3-domain-containing protein [Mycena floridula]